MTDHRLSQIQTLWSVVRRAHDDQATQMQAAQEAMIERYGGAIRRYLLAALKSADAADDVYQNFAVKFMKGDFQNATPEKGRFRSFLKTVIYHLIVDYQRKLTKDKINKPLNEEAGYIAEAGDSDSADDFETSWRDELLHRAWELLRAEEEQSGKPYHTVLKYRAEHPSQKSPELATAVTGILGREIKAGNVRVILHRARELFADLLLEEVRHSLDSPTRDALEEELIDINLLSYCKDSLAKLS